MAQLAHNISNELLACKICFCPYSRPAKLPKCLQCPHTFCAHCLKQMLTKCAKPTLSGLPAGNRITCPICRELTTLPEAGVRGLTNNLTILTLMDMVSGAPIACSPLTRTRLVAPKEGQGRCVQCTVRYPESQFTCGHCVCDACLKKLLDKNEDYCPQCGPPVCKDDVEEQSIAPKPLLNKVSGTSRTVALQENTKSLPSSPSHHHNTPKTLTAASSEKQVPYIHDNSLPNRHLEVNKAKPVTHLPPARPPPFNPTFLTLRDSGASEAPNPHKKYTVRPYGGRASSLSDQGMMSDSDNISLCSMVSDSSVPRSASNLQISTLRRTQSMRRPPPPTPRRKMGTLPRRTLAPPCIATTRSAENVSIQNETCPHTKITEGIGSLQGASAPIGVSPPVPPMRRIFKTQNASPTKCIKKFGRYNEMMQTSCFRKPSRVSLSENGAIIVTDTCNMTVQLFSSSGDYISMFKVLGAQDACFISIDKVCVASHIGVHIYSCSGHKITDIHIKPIVSVASYKFGFVAASTKSLHIFRQSLNLVKEMNKFKSIQTKKWSPIHKKTQFVLYNIRDICVTALNTIAVLDGGSNWTVYILNEDCVCSLKIDAAKLACGPLSDTQSVAADLSGNIYLADSGHNRVLKLSSTGAFIRCVLSFRSRIPHGICVTVQGNLVVALTGDHIAEIRIYNQDL